MAEAGQRARVRGLRPPGHVRTPWYLRGKTGVVERRLGKFANPEQLAYRQEARRSELLRVRFKMSEIWGEEAERPEDTVDAEIFEHWLETEETGR